MHRLHVAAFIASTLVALWAGSAPAQTAAPAASAPPAERSSYPLAGARLEGAALVRALREGGLVIYFRHTATDFSKNDRGMRDFDDCANQRPLSDQGRADARDDGPAHRGAQAADRRGQGEPDVPHDGTRQV